MGLDKALEILNIVKCDNLGYARDLSYDPKPEEIGEAIETIEEFITSVLKMSADAVVKAFDKI